ncbi:MAG TPA: autotransporter-associated beta strand repeat-containing protein, partial [Humisphaera sp.]
VRSSVASRPMSLGGTNAAVAGINLTDAELARIATTAAGTVTFGDSAQTGDVTLTTAAPATTAGTAVQVVQAAAGAGKVVLENGAGTGPSVTATGGTLTVTAGLGGVVEAAGNTSAATDVSGFTSVSLTAGGAIGTAALPVQFGTTALTTSTSAGNANQFLKSTGTVTATSFNAGTGTVELDGGTFAYAASNPIADASKLNVNGSTLSLGAFGDTVDTFTLTAGSITGTGTLTSTNTIQTKSGSVAARLAGANGLAQSTAGTTTLTGPAAFGGSTAVNGGRLVFSEQTVPTATVSVAAGATLEYAAAGSFRQATLTITGGGTLLKSGAGTLTFGGAGTINWQLGSGALIDVQGGKLVGGNFIEDVWTTNLSDLNIATGATFDGIEANVRVDKLTGSGTLATGYPGAGYVAFTAGVNGGSSTFAGTVTNSEGGGSFVKEGAGTITLSGANTYTGTTTVLAGTLALASTTSNNNVAASPSIEVKAAATLDVTGLDNGATTDTLALAAGQTLTGGGTVVGRTVAASGATVAPGSPGPGVLATGDVTLQAAATLAAQLNGTTAGTGYDQLTVTGAVNVAGSTLSITGTLTPAAGQTFTIVDNDGTDLVAGTFNGLPEGAAITNFMGSALKATISYVGGTGNDVVLTVAAATPPSVTQATVNNGAAQRSKVRTLAVRFDRVVTIDLAAVSLVRTTTGAAVANVSLNLATATVGGATVLTVTFAGSGLVDAGNSTGSLADGRYTLKIAAAGVADATSASTTLAADYAFKFFRLYGDADGDGVVSTSDTIGVGRVMLNRSAPDPLYREEMDRDGGVFTIADYNGLRSRLGLDISSVA